MDVYLKWNWVNWITVVLMVSIFYVAFGFIAQAVRGAAGVQ
jgi:hypothetical protein